MVGTPSAALNRRLVAGAVVTVAVLVAVRSSSPAQRTHVRTTIGRRP
ncbi:hypothetical protein [Kocuria oceani]|nr:hypothetical protein [Kocuria oceani]